MAESDVHRRLKRLACRWLWQQGYAAIAEEVKVPGLGIIDVAAAGQWKRRNGRAAVFERQPAVDRRHVAFVECKAMRADFLRDQGRQRQFAFALAERDHRRRAGRHGHPPYASPALGKFAACLVRPCANLHYLLVAPDVLTLAELPRRWGLLVYRDRSIRVVRAAQWQEVSRTDGIEAAIARALTFQHMRALNPAPHLRRTEPRASASGPPCSTTEPLASAGGLPCTHPHRALDLDVARKGWTG